MQPVSGLCEFYSETDVLFSSSLAPSSFTSFSFSFSVPVYLSVNADFFPVVLGGSYSASMFSCTSHSSGVIFDHLFDTFEYLLNSTSYANSITIRATNSQNGQPYVERFKIDETQGWLMRASMATSRFLGAQEEPVPGPTSAIRLFVLKTFRRVNAKRGDMVVFNQSHTFVINQCFRVPGPYSIFELQEVGEEGEWSMSRS